MCLQLHFVYTLMIHSGVCCYLGLIPGDVGRVKVHSSMRRDKTSMFSAHTGQEGSHEEETDAANHSSPSSIHSPLQRGFYHLLQDPRSKRKGRRNRGSVWWSQMVGGRGYWVEGKMVAAVVVGVRSNPITIPGRLFRAAPNRRRVSEQQRWCRSHTVDWEWCRHPIISAAAWPWPVYI